MTERAKPRPKPCDSCPYRRDVPSGLWAESEYVKLPEYDGPTHEQPIAVFHCHQADGTVCAGWAHHADINTLALRLNWRHVDVRAICAYQSPVPLFASGAEAAEHGIKDIEEPGEEARAMVAKLMQLRERRNRAT